MIPFVPRKVAQKSAKTQLLPTRSEATDDATAKQVAGPSGISGHNGVYASPSAPAASLKGKEREVDAVKSTVLSDEAYGDLLQLSLSDHALWLDAELRRRIEDHREGYIPLTYLLRHSPYLSSLKPPPTEAVIIKAIRIHAADIFDLRVLFSEPSRALWFGGPDATMRDTSGGYEIRLKKWEAALHRARNYNREEWEERTVYMENIPLQYRSIHGIYRFASRILPQNRTAWASSNAHISSIQSISLPKHHQDKPEDQPKCKGFALVTLSTPELSAWLVEEWPWRRKSQTKDAPDKSGADAHDACRFGFRVLRKIRWDQLKEEYLARRTSLLDQIAEVNRLHRQEPMDEEDDVSERGEPSPILKRKRTPSPAPQMKTTTLASPYPFDCLVFIKNIHPETNKTTLRTLFSHAFVSQTDSANDGVDYVDFTKGIDSCYLRLASPDHATQLLSYFEQNSLSHMHGLDNTGSTRVEGKKCIAVELVDGKREELYWAKVPEKVRRQAVEKAVRSGNGGEEDAGMQGANSAGGQGKRQRKKKG